VAECAGAQKHSVLPWRQFFGDNSKVTRRGIRILPTPSAQAPRNDVIRAATKRDPDEALTPLEHVPDKVEAGFSKTTCEGK
jgi:hypothetical protein